MGTRGLPVCFNRQTEKVKKVLAKWVVIDILNFEDYYFCYQQAVNAYYACYLYGLTSGDMNLASFSQTLMSMEIHSAQRYWHMINNDVYDTQFAANRMAGSSSIVCTLNINYNAVNVGVVGALATTSSTVSYDKADIIIVV